jgi:hypothetical protein
MFLNYVALILILIVIVIIFYVFIYIHELPYEAAKHRNHPQADAIYVACWLSLFTLHALWPIIFIWALTHKDESHGTSEEPAHGDPSWALRMTELENRLLRLEERHSQPTNGSGVA